MPKPKSDNVRINLMMPPKTVKALKILAKKRGTSYSELMRVACHDFAVTELRKEAQSPVPEAAEVAETPEAVGA